MAVDPARELAMSLVDSREQMPWSLFLLASAASVLAMLWLLIWGLVGFDGVFWITYRYRQYWYFFVVAGTLLIALCGTRYFRLHVPAMVLSCAIGGYLGSVVAYTCFAFSAIARGVDAGNYSFILRPLVVPFHLPFILAGFGTGLLILVISMACVAITRSRLR